MAVSEIGFPAAAAAAEGAFKKPLFKMGET